MRLKTAVAASLIFLSSIAFSSRAIAQGRDYVYPLKSEPKTEKAFRLPAKQVRKQHFRMFYPLDEQNFSFGASAYLCGKSVPCAGASLSRKSRISDNVAFNWGSLMGAAILEQRLSGKVEDNRSPSGQGSVTYRHVQFRQYDIITLFPFEVGECRLGKRGYPSLSFLGGGLVNIAYSTGKGVDSIFFYSSSKTAMAIADPVGYQCVKICFGLMAGVKARVAPHVALTAFYAREWSALREGLQVDDPGYRGMLGVGVSYLFTYHAKGAGLPCPRY